MDKKWKYEEWVKVLKTPCPPENHEGRETIAYRWVFEPMEREANQLPQYFKSERYGSLSNQNLICKALGLSFFDTLENALVGFKTLEERVGVQAFSFGGTHIAKVALTPEDGVCDHPSDTGHFTFHPFETFILADVSEIVFKIQ